MSEAEEIIGGRRIDGKRQFKNGDIHPDNKDLVCWGYNGDEPWWVDWSSYWRMAKGHKGLVRQKRKVGNVVKRGLL
jgi:hypothetical protein